MVIVILMMRLAMHENDHMALLVVLQHMHCFCTQQEHMHSTQIAVVCCMTITLG
jgi:hypothetical protein